MPKKNQPPQAYKTETQLKEEALAKKAAEAEASAAVHKSELQKKRENFWYHYKWHTVAGVFAAFLLIFFIKDIVFRTKPDATIVVVSESYLGDYEMSFLTPAIDELATDYNEDKKVLISTDFISLPSLADGSAQNEPAADLTGGQQEMASAMKLMAVLAAGSDPIYLLDEAAYDYISGMGESEGGHEADNVFDAFSVPAEKLGGEAAGMFRGMRFYLRTSHKDEAYYEYCKQLLENIDRS